MSVGGQKQQQQPMRRRGIASAVGVCSCSDSRSRKCSCMPVPPPSLSAGDEDATGPAEEDPKQQLMEDSIPRASSTEGAMPNVVFLEARRIVKD